MSIRAYVDPRRLDQRVKWQRNIGAQDEAGEVVPEWADLMESWAAIDGAKAAGEPVVADGERSVGDYTIWIRADVYDRAGLRVKDRGVWKTKRGLVIFDIRDIPDQQLRGRLIGITASTGLNQG